MGRKKKRNKAACGAELATATLITDSEHRQGRPLALPSMFWKPIYLDGSQPYWIGHLPFAFWITDATKPSVLVELGTHTGNSYFGFCQAVDRLQIDTRCYAVDTWRGDQHTGLYSEDVFRSVNEYNTEHYSEFSTLIRATFDDALAYFEDGSIDLLHIDGCHTFEAIRHDFEAWLPKLSPRAVVLLHDTNVRRDDFGVHRFFDSMSQEYPTFCFHHSHGLGVVGVGGNQSLLLLDLFEMARSSPQASALHRIFSRLGQACLDRAERGALAERVTLLEKEKIDREADRAQLLTDLEHATSNRNALQEQLSSLAATAQDLQAQAADREYYQRSLNERFTEVGTLTKDLTAAEDTISTLEAKIAQDRGSLSRRITDLEQVLRETHINSLLNAHSAQCLARDKKAMRESLEWRIGHVIGRLFGSFSFRSRQRRELRQERKIILDSGYFDESFYATTYLDVAKSRMDAVDHFLNFGAREARNPSPHFNTAAYLLSNSDVAYSPAALNPLVHYIQFGKKEERSLA